MKNSRNNGFSLIEILITLSIVAVGLTLALPSWNDVRSKRELVGASESLSAFLSLGRSLALKHNRDVAASLTRQDATHWCFGLTDQGHACDCMIEDAGQSGYCSVGGVPQVLYAEEQAQTELISHSADTSFVFDHVVGTVASADLTEPHYFNLKSSNGETGLQVGVSAIGNTFICSWLGGANAPGYRSCEPSEAPGSTGDDGALRAD